MFEICCLIEIRKMKFKPRSPFRLNSCSVPSQMSLPPRAVNQDQGSALWYLRPMGIDMNAVPAPCPPGFVWLSAHNKAKPLGKNVPVFWPVRIAWVRGHQG